MYLAINSIEPQEYDYLVLVKEQPQGVDHIMNRGLSVINNLYNKKVFSKQQGGIKTNFGDDVIGGETGNVIIREKNESIVLYSDDDGSQDEVECETSHSCGDVVEILDQIDDKPIGPHRCPDPWGGYPLSHGDSLIAYKTEMVNYPDTCLSEDRECAYGTLGGSFSFASCYQAGNECYAPDGKVFPHDSIATYYLYDIVTGKSENGIDLCPREARLCIDGERHTLDKITQGFGAYVYPFCSAVVP